MKKYTSILADTAWEPLVSNSILNRIFDGIVNGKPLVSAPKTDRALPPIGYNTDSGKIRYFHGDEDTRKLSELYETLEADGFRISEVPYSFIWERFGDYVGYRDGKTLYVARDDGKRELSPREKAYIAAHEAKEKSHKFDEKPHDVVHKEAEGILANLKHYSALDVAERVGKKMGWARAV